jgi:NADH-ubiquinone oxidoreductase chain 5
MFKLFIKNFNFQKNLFLNTLTPQICYQIIAFFCFQLIILYLTLLNTNFISFLNFINFESHNLLLPLITLIPIILGLFSRLLGRKGVKYFIVISYMFLFALFQNTFYQMIIFNKYSMHILTYGQWLNVGLFDVRWEFSLDPISLFMLLIVLLITFCVLLYSIGYLNEDPHLLRFLFYISLFSFFMVLLVTAHNFIVLFMGWEGVGICSYLLISFWFTRLKAVKAGLKAVVMNRIGDTGVLMAIVLCILYFQTLDFSEILILSQISNSFYHILVCHLICICLFLGVIGKSAQMGLHTWLLLAMEGPTPASALIHAATMVTAGIFLMIRLSSLFMQAPAVLLLAVFVGSITTLFAGVCALVQTDMKRIVAFSTTSQLGYMLLTCGLTNFSLSFFHLINHAFFKAMLFMTMGIVIHVISSEQDLRKVGSLLTIIPLVYTSMQIGNSALTGLIFTTGFFSKDLIIEVSVLSHTIFIDSIAQQIATVTAVLTFLYSSRVLYYLFFNGVNINNNTVIHFKNDLAYLYVIMPLLPLMIFSIFFGYFARTFFIGSTNVFDNVVMAQNIDINLFVITAELLPFYIKLLPAFFAILFSFLALTNFSSIYIILINQARYIKNINPLNLVSIIHFLYWRWYSDKYFDLFFKKILNIGQTYVIETLERGTFDLIQGGSKYSVREIFLKIGLLLRSFAQGNMHIYITFILLTVLTMFLFNTIL